MQQEEVDENLEFNSLEHVAERKLSPWSRSYGNYIIIMRKQNGEPWLMLGPHWYIFLVAFALCFSLFTFMLTSITNQLTTFWFWLLTISVVSFLISYLAIGLSNPGFATPLSKPTFGEKQSTRFCQICQTMKNRDVYHCEDWYDHHCPWIGKCVGENNTCLFYIFLILIFGTLIMCFIGTISSASSIPHDNNIRNGMPRVQG